MTGPLQEWRERFAGFFRGRRQDAEFDEEISAHLEMAVEDNLRRGMSPAEARRAAAVRFGGRWSAVELAGDQRGLPWLESIFKDFGYALRGMRKNLAFTTVVIVTLALGIGANTALFSLVEAVMLRQLPVRDPGSLYFLVNAGDKGPNGAPPYACYRMMADHAQSFDGMAAYTGALLTVTIDRGLEVVSGEFASGRYFEVLGVRPALGRAFTAADEQSRAPVAVLSYAYWQKRFGGNPDVLGRTILLDQTRLTIVGVAARGFNGMTPGRQSNIMVPFLLQPAVSLNSPTWFFDVVARLKAGVDPRRARAEIDPIFQAYVAPMTDLASEMRRGYLDHMELLPASKGADFLRKRWGAPVTILMVVVGVVLLVGCSNLANLFLARASSREKEFAVRLALGAGRWRLARQLLMETMVLFACGAAAGLLLASWGSRLLAGYFAVGRMPWLVEPYLNSSVLAFTAAVALVTGLVFGVAPTLATALSQSAGTPLASNRGATDSPARTRVRHALVVAQIALSLVLLVSGGLFVRTLSNLNHLDLGFRPEGVLTMSVQPTGPGYTDARLDEFWDNLLRRVRAVPGVASASVSILTPFNNRERGVRVSVPGFHPTAGMDLLATQNHISDSYLETFGIRLVAGRTLTAADREGAPGAILINEAAANFYFHGRNPLGGTVELGSGAQHRVYTVVGVAGDARHANLRESVPRFLYIPTGQRREHLTRLTLAIRTQGDPTQLAGAVQREVRTLGTDVLISEVLTMRQQVDAVLVQERLLSTVGGFFSILAVVLSAVGLYGLLTHVVGRRTGEIGIRMALGADRGAVVWMILRRSLWLMAIGIGVGVPTTLWAARPLQALLYGLQPTDATTVTAAVLVLAATATIASYLPARRASHIDPMTALRSE